MPTRDAREIFTLGIRVPVFDRVRHDARAPDHYGSTVIHELLRPSTSPSTSTTRFAS